MKRWGLRIFVFLLLGAIVNVAVAWGCAVWAPGHRHEGPSLDKQAWPDVTGYGVPQSDRVEAMRVENPGLTFTTVFTHHGVLAMTSAGWPTNSMEGALRFTDIGGFEPTVPILIGALALGDNIRERDPELPNWPFVLPLRPIWSSFGINTALYAAIFCGAWLLFTAPFALRRRRRIKRGLCAGCGYPWGAGAVCSECGSAIVRRTAAHGAPPPATPGSATDRRRLKSWSPVIFALIIAQVGGCRAHDRYAISVRDIDTSAAVKGVKLTTRYGFLNELSGALPFRGPCLHSATTNRDGRATLKVDSGLSWWVQIEAPGREMQMIRFNADGTPKHPAGRIDVVNGWITAKLFSPSEENGSLAVSSSKVEE